jgi:hypothetical protein
MEKQRIAFRGRKRLSGMDELEEEKKMSTKRLHLRAEAKELLNMSREKKGHIILQLFEPVEVEMISISRKAAIK